MRSRPMSFKREMTVDAAREALYEFEGVLLIDDPARRRVRDPGRVRRGVRRLHVARTQDPTVPHGLQLWIVADNLRKGAALNAVQSARP